jgi:hypothetical protein
MNVRPAGSVSVNWLAAGAGTVPTLILQTEAQPDRLTSKINQIDG